MDLSTSMRYVMMRAQAEAATAKSGGEPAVEFLFLELLKLAEIQAEDFAPASRHKAEIDADIGAVRALFKDAGIDIARTRSLLRRAVASGAKSGGSELSACLTAAAARAAGRGAEDVWGQDMLAAILENPTGAILEVCPLKKPAAVQKAVQQDAAGEETETKQGPSDEMSREFLPSLTCRIRHMRAKLLSTVHGQDHVVHAFTEGMFAAEVLAASDEKRKRPRAIFVFAGPPDVGKTFLAEQAAEALEIPFKRFDMRTVEIRLYPSWRFPA